MEVFVLLYGNKHGTDASVFSTEALAFAAADAIRAEYPDEFDDDDPLSYIDIVQRTLNQ